MEYFIFDANTIPDGLGFSHYSALHLVWLAFFVVLTVFCCLHYRRLSEKGRKIWRIVIAALLIVDEVFKQVMLIAGGNWLPEYLPLHLCSINIFLVTFHAFKPGKAVGNFLYTVCIPGALAALLFPSWDKLPFMNFMHIHSFTVHILLAMYLMVLAVNGDIRPEAKQIPRCIAALLVLAVIMRMVNPLLDANFFFMTSADKGNPLYWFQENWGNHLYGFPVLVTAVLLVMHGPLALVRALRKKKAVAK